MRFLVWWPERVGLGCGENIIIITRNVSQRSIIGAAIVCIDAGIGSSAVY